MKITWLSGRLPAVLAFGLIVLGGLSAGCSDDDEVGSTGPTSTKITVEEIIFNPKSPAPGDTLRATAVVTSTSQNVGDAVEYKWTATGGVFLETNKASVRWVAPVQSAIFSLTVEAKNSVNTAKLTDGVFVGLREPFIEQFAGELFPIPASDAVYYTSAPGLPTDGLIIRRKEGVADEAPFGTSHRGTQFSFDRDRTLSAHMYVEPNPKKLSVFCDDLQSAQGDTIMRDQRAFPLRPSEFQWPRVSADGQYVAFQGGLLDQVSTPAQGGVDTFAVFLYHRPSDKVQRATFKGYPDRIDVSNSFYPSVSSGGQRLVFVSDRAGPLVWEYYALPISGATATPDTIANALVQLTDTGGQMASGTTVPPGRLQTQWNPGSLPILAVVGANARLYLVPADGSGQVDVAIATGAKVTDVRWAPDGDLLAAVITDADGLAAIHEVNLGGETSVITAGEAGDKIADIEWSPDGEILVYTISRGTDVWYEMVDFGGATGLTEPVRISPAARPSALAKSYGPPLQSLRPAWRAGSRIAYLFMLEGSTPGVVSVDLSGIGD